MKCSNCRFYDMNDTTNAFGTCEPQDTDYHCAHECNLSKNEIKELESLTEKNKQIRECITKLKCIKVNPNSTYFHDNV